MTDLIFNDIFEFKNLTPTMLTILSSFIWLTFMFSIVGGFIIIHNFENNRIIKTIYSKASLRISWLLIAIFNIYYERPFIELLKLIFIFIVIGATSLVSVMLMHLIYSASQNMIQRIFNIENEFV
jgi:hypothetical protein